MRLRTVCVLLALAGIGDDPGRAADGLVTVSDPGVRLPPGFRITRFADHDLAPDIHCLTFDSLGRVVVAGPGYIKTLLDVDKDGVADDAVLFAETGEGATGLCFEGPELYAVVDGGIFRFEDRDRDGQADDAPEQVLKVGGGEHGAHGLRRGPDGFFYLIGGNDAGFDSRYVTGPESPVRQPEAGAWLRLSPDFRQCSVMAHGFRNPVDFDFDWTGGAFTVDSDAERDVLLPWYTPTRLHHIGVGGHHGWRLPGYLRSWNRPDYYADTVSALETLGRGSPTGVTAYRHDQFPPRYQDGFFFADWTFGRIQFTPFEWDGAGYASAADVFLEPAGAGGFAPTSLAVGPDGSLWVATGGRGTRGGVYRMDYPGGGRTTAPTGAAALVPPLVRQVLQAPQPLSAWSRAEWVPVAQELGPEQFVLVTSDRLLPVGWRVRAIEVLTELFGGLEPSRARLLVDSRDPEVRARLAWSLGRQGTFDAMVWLLPLLRDDDPFVRRCAVEAVAEHLPGREGPDLLGPLLAALTDEDKSLRLAGTWAVSRLSQAGWLQTGQLAGEPSPGLQLMFMLASIWRQPDRGVHPDVLGAAGNLLRGGSDPELQLDALRLAIHALGDWNLARPTVEVFTGYEAAGPPAGDPAGLEVRRQLRLLVRPLINGATPEIQIEAMRLLAMLGDDDAATARALLYGVTYGSEAPGDFHRLACLARFQVTLTQPADLHYLAGAIIAFDRKLAGGAEHPKLNWNDRFRELVQALCQRHPGLPEALVRHSVFGQPGQVALVPLLPPAQQLAAARRLLAGADRNPRLAWPPTLVDVLGLLPPAETAGVWTRLWANPRLHDVLLPRLAQAPATNDFPKFTAGLDSSHRPAAVASVMALRRLPVDAARSAAPGALRLLHRLAEEPGMGPLRREVLSLVESNLNHRFEIAEPVTPGAEASAAYAPVFEWVRREQPAIAARMDAGLGGDPDAWRRHLRTVPWAAGRAERGAALYYSRGCAACHSGEAMLGPDLAGAAGRWGAEQLLFHVAFPDREVAPAYQATRVVMTDGTVLLGRVVFTAKEGTMLQTDPLTTVRLPGDQILSQVVSEKSLMPSGLLEGLSPTDLADLHAYLAEFGSGAAEPAN